ncbi:VOC family protein [Microbacterium abyssi]|uniref:VOC family protein n=1 Tax=Microbacterium abyssi TaxID=2782166 RepID=UPI001886B7DF|nr:VOC family protein [Microbacterium sp. A18JL241]
MSAIKRFDHVGITVSDLEEVTRFFLDLGLERLGDPTPMEGEFLDAVCGIPGAKTTIVMLQVPGGGTGVELSTFHRPALGQGQPEAMANELGIRSIAFEVAGLEEMVARLTAEGYRLDGSVGEFEDQWRMTYVRGPEGIIVALAERLG